MRRQFPQREIVNVLLEARVTPWHALLKDVANGVRAESPHVAGVSRVWSGVRSVERAQNMAISTASWLGRARSRAPIATLHTP